MFLKSQGKQYEVCFFSQQNKTDEPEEKIEAKR